MYTLKKIEEMDEYFGIGNQGFNEIISKLNEVIQTVNKIIEKQNE